MLQLHMYILMSDISWPSLCSSYMYQDKPSISEEYLIVYPGFLRLRIDLNRWLDLDCLDVLGVYWERFHLVLIITLLLNLQFIQFYFASLEFCWIQFQIFIVMQKSTVHIWPYLTLLCFQKFKDDYFLVCIKMLYAECVSLTIVFTVDCTLWCQGVPLPRHFVNFSFKIAKI